MILKEFDLWRQAAESYWHLELDGSSNLLSPGQPYSNLPQLKGEVTSYLDGLRAIFEAYVADDTRLDTVRSVLLSLLVYLNLKVVSTVPGIEVADLIPDDDVRNWFEYWTYELPDPSVLFSHRGVTLQEPDPGDPTGEATIETPTSEGELLVEPGYETLKGDLEAAVETDKTTMREFSEMVAPATRERIVYQAFTGGDAVVEYHEEDPKKIILEDLKMGEVLETFEWKVQGVN
jgi:hypothetical protein